MRMSIFGYSRAVRRQAGQIMVTFRLTKIMVANAVNEYRQHRPGHKEQYHCREWVNTHPHLQPSRPGRQPVDR